MFSPKMLQNCHFQYKYKILEKKAKTFLTYRTIRFYSKLAQEDVKKFQNFHCVDCKILEFELTKFLFWPCKKWGVALYKLMFV